MPAIRLLLGRPDQPTDAIEDFSRCLASALEAWDIEATVVRVPWQRLGWRRAVKEALEEIEAGDIGLLQYTALQWTDDGVPSRLPRLLGALEEAGARPAVIFHDRDGDPGARYRDQLRRFFQRRLMRRLVARSERTILTVPPEEVPWLDGDSSRRIAHIPVGPNLVPPGAELRPRDARTPEPPYHLVVFGMSAGAAGRRQAAWISRIARQMRRDGLRVHLNVFGRHVAAVAEELRNSLAEADVPASIEGVLSAEEARERFRRADLQLFVRGDVSTNRGGLISGLTMGLPAVAFVGRRLPGSLAETGLTPVPMADDRNAARAAAAILTDKARWSGIRAASLEGAATHFGWGTVAVRYARLFGFDVGGA